MQSVTNAPWKPFTSRSNPGQARSWRSLDAIEALRTLFLKDLLARPLNKEEHMAGLWDRQGSRWVVFDVDGTREAARQRALPQTPDRPSPQRRLRPICAAFLHRAQARRSRPHPYHSLAGSYVSVARHVWQSGPR